MLLLQPVIKPQGLNNVVMLCIIMMYSGTNSAFTQRISKWAFMGEIVQIKIWLSVCCIIPSRFFFFTDGARSVDVIILQHLSRICFQRQPSKQMSRGTVSTNNFVQLQLLPVDSMAFPGGKKLITPPALPGSAPWYPASAQNAFLRSCPGGLLVRCPYCWQVSNFILYWWCMLCHCHGYVRMKPWGILM